MSIDNNTGHPGNTSALIEKRLAELERAQRKGTESESGAKASQERKSTGTSRVNTEGTRRVSEAMRSLGWFGLKG